MNKKIILIFAVLLVICCFQPALAAKTEIVLDYSNYSISEDGDYSLLNINVEGVSISNFPLSLALPVGIMETSIPGDALIADSQVIGFENPIDLKIENIPSWNNGYTSRVCFKETLEPRIKFTDRYDMNGMIVVSAEILPVEVLNCSAGEFRLYTKVRYAIEHMSESPITFLTKIPQTANPDSMMNVSVMVSKLKPGTLQGEFVVESGDEVLGRTDATITQDGEIIDFEATSPSRSGSHLTKVSYLENGKNIFTREYWIEVEGANIKIEAPEEIGPNQAFNMKILLQNNMEETSANCSIRVYRGAVNVIRKSKVFQINPGQNILWAEVKTIGVEKGDYVMDVDCYIGEDKFSDFSMITIGKAKSSKTEGESFASSTAFAVIAIIALFAIVIYLVRIYMKGD